MEVHLRFQCFSVMPPPQEVSDKTDQPGIGKNARVTLAAKHSDTETMAATTWTGKKSITVEPERAKPLITDAVR